jgi:hypothetical protein
MREGRTEGDKNGMDEECEMEVERQVDTSGL